MGKPTILTSLTSSFSSNFLNLASRNCISSSYSSNCSAFKTPDLYRAHREVCLVDKAMQTHWRVNYYSHMDTETKRGPKERRANTVKADLKISSVKQMLSFIRIGKT